MAIGCALGGCARSEPRGAILILLDAARADRFSAYGYPRPTTPSMDRLAGRGVVFRNHYTQGTYTRSALPSLLYSRYYFPPLFPNSDRVPFSAPRDLLRAPDPESLSLPRALSLAGFRTAMISAHLWLKPQTQFASEFDEAYDLSTLLVPDGERRHPRAEQVIDFAIAWLDRNADRDYFLYLHLMDTHFPHRFEEDARRFIDSETYSRVRLERFSPEGRPRDLEAELSEPDRAYLDALYDGSLRYADRHVGRLLEHLGDRLDGTLIAITSDHGEHLLERPGRFAHGGPWYETVARVPLILSLPRKLPPRVSEALTESIDLMPTLMDLLGVSLPAGKRADGVSLRRVLDGEIPPRGHVFAKHGVRSRGVKCLFSDRDEALLAREPPTPDRLEGELYDVETDPLEGTNLWSSRRELVEECLERYRERMTAPHERYLATTATGPPSSPFAIGAEHFGALGGGARALHEREPRLAVIAGWLAVKAGEGSYLVASAGAEPLRVDLPIPDGRYALSAAVSGAAQLWVEGGPRVRLETERAEPAGGASREPMEHVDCGEIEVRENRLQLTLAPERDGRVFAIRYLGFRPLGTRRDAPLDAQQESDLLERLRELGYAE
jgi:arylsulfatase A-like enzyme